VYDDEGKYDENVFCLPPDKCYCFRKPEEYDDDEEDDDEEDKEDDDEEDDDEEEDKKEH